MAIAPKLSPRRAGWLMLAALLAFAGGCGGDGDAESRPDSEEITKAVERVLESDDVDDQCERGVTRRFVREIYLSAAHCRDATKPDPGDPPPDTAKVSAIRIDGDRATAGVELTSVKGSRATGRLALVRVADTWKVDRLGVDFLRSVFSTLPAEAAGSAERRVLRCVAYAARALPDADVRRIGNLVVGRRLTARSLPAEVTACLRGGDASTT
jgi:hypothetical protein